jgi:hypothetical protein
MGLLKCSMAFYRPPLVRTSSGAISIGGRPNGSTVIGVIDRRVGWIGSMVIAGAMARGGTDLASHADSSAEILGAFEMDRRAVTGSVVGVFS